MENVHSAAIPKIFLHCHGPLPTSSVAFLLVSSCLATYAILVTAEGLIVDVYRKTATVSLSLGSGGVGGDLICPRRYEADGLDVSIAEFY